MRIKTTEEVSDIISRSSFFGSVEDIEKQKKAIEDFKWVAVDDILSLFEQSKTDFLPQQGINIFAKVLIDSLSNDKEKEE